MTAAIVWVCLYLILRNNCLRKPRKGVLDPLCLFLENPREYPHKPYTARNYIVPAEDFRCYVSIFISFHAIIFENRTVGSQTKGCEKRI